MSDRPDTAITTPADHLAALQAFILDDCVDAGQAQGEIATKEQYHAGSVASQDTAPTTVGELGISRQLTLDERRRVVADLREEGHSLRAIAGAVGVDKETVRQDLAGVEDSTPATVTGRDGKSYPAKRET